jgi:hypothetical protein
MMKRDVFPPSIQNLLLSEGQRFTDRGRVRQALGSGVVPIIGSARAAKTTAAYCMIDYVIQHTTRPVILESFPDVVLKKGIPKHWRGRVKNTPFTDIATVDEPAVWLVDDTGTSFNSRDSMSSNSKTLARVAGVLSHFGGGMTVIFTSQLLSGVDVSFMRYTTLAPVIRFIDPNVIGQERREWIGQAKHAQHELRSVCQDPMLRDYFYSLSDNLLVKSPFPAWLDKTKIDPIKADLLSRPMRYHSPQKKAEMIGQAKPKKKKKNKVMEE